MTLFGLLAALLAVVALGFVLTPLLRRRDPLAPDARLEANAAVYRDQLKELETEQAQGLISAARLAEAKHEIEFQLAEELRSATRSESLAAGRSTRLAATLGVLLPAFAVTLYIVIGTPAALLPPLKIEASAPSDAHDLETMLPQLEARLRDAPADADAWWMLARAQRVLGRFSDAAGSYARLMALVGRTPDLLADAADVLAMQQERRLTGEPFRLIEEALAIDPKHPKSLALAGAAAFQSGDFGRARAHWSALLPLLPPESELAASVRDSLAQIESRLGEAPKSAAPPAASPAIDTAASAIEGTVHLDPALAAHASPEDVLFVIARPASGARMPLAVSRVTVRDLPYRFKLDDSMAMTPAARISGAQRVIVAARISKTGDALPKPGDLEGESRPVPPGTRDVSVTISTERK